MVVSKSGQPARVCLHLLYTSRREDNICVAMGSQVSTRLSERACLYPHAAITLASLAVRWAYDAGGILRLVGSPIRFPSRYTY